MQVATVAEDEAEDEADPFSALIEIPDESPTPETIRRTHATIEASIKALGVLCLLGALWGAVRLLAAFAAQGARPTATHSALFAAAWLIAAVACATWLWALDPRGRRLYTLLFIVDLAVFACQASQAHALLALVRGALATTATSQASLVMATTSQPSLAHDLPLQLAAGIALLLVRLASLCVLWSRKGRTVMGAHYRRAIIPATSRPR